MERYTYQFDEVRGSLVFSEPKIELELNKGDVVSGSFDIEEQSGLTMEGYVYSSNIRMRVEDSHIEGDNITVGYEFDSVGMNIGDTLRGNFNIVTNRGEFVLPFTATVRRNNITSSLGNIKNLFHFTNLAKSNWDEAIEVFYSPDFDQIMSGNDSRYRSLYKGLTAGGNKNCNLEEFLVGINKKSKVEYTLDKDSIVHVNPSDDLKETINLRRSGWGYTLIGIKVIGDYINIDRNRISGSDFENDVCSIEVSFDTSKLHSGKNPGRIIFKTIYEEKTVEVEVVKNTFARRTSAGHKKKVLFSLTRHYMDYTIKKINMSKWLMLTDELLGHRVDIDDDDIANSLMQVHSLIIQERFNEAKWILDKRVKSRIEEANNELYCYYLYMNALYSADDYYTKDIADQIQSIYNNDPTNWRISWILMKISDELRKSPGKRFSFSLEQIRMGCSSPIIYLEAIKALSESPSLLMHLEREEKRILVFGAKEGILTKDVMAQVSYLVMKVKNFDKSLLKLMRIIYDKTGSDESLQSVCVQLMKGGKTGPEYFEYYNEAVERNFPLTKLYEAYMMSMDIRRDEPIPKRVLMYFSFQSELPPKQNAYLYAYIVKNKEEIQDIYLACKDNIDRFVLKQLYQERIDRNLAYLYSEIILEEMDTEDNLKQFSSLLFKHLLTTDDRKCVRAIVIDDRLKDEKVYPLSGGQAFVALLNPDSTILLEDELGNRFYKTKEYSTEKFFLPGRVMGRMENDVTDNLEYDLFVCEDSPDFLIISDQNVDRYRFIESNEAVDDEYRGRLRLPLIRYYMEKDDTKEVDEILNHVGYDDIGYKDYNELIRTMLIRGMYDRALDFVIRFGVENIEPKILVRLTGRLLERDGYVEKNEMTYALMSAFDRGKYDDHGLSYLTRFYRGPIKTLRNIWKSANNFYTETYEICERMIIQTLETGAYIGEEALVLKQYVEGGARVEVEMKFLSYYSHEFFVKGRPVDSYMFSEIERLYRREGEISDVCMLAWLKFMAEERDRGTQPDEDDIGMISDALWYLVIKKGIIFPFFATFKDISAVAAQISNQTLVEYKGTPEVKTVINYVISKDREENGGYSREEMTDMYGGIYVKAFLLYFGESLQYYITEEHGGVEQFTESETRSLTETAGDSDNNRYSLVNDIAVADTLKDYDTTMRLLEEYKYKEYLVNSIFDAQ